MLERRLPTVIKGVRAWYPLDHGQEPRYPQEQEEVCQLKSQQPEQGLPKLCVFPNTETVASSRPGAAVVAGYQRHLFSVVFAVHTFVCRVRGDVLRKDPNPFRHDVVTRWERDIMSAAFNNRLRIAGRDLVLVSRRVDRKKYDGGKPVVSPLCGGVPYDTA